MRALTVDAKPSRPWFVVEKLDPEPGRVAVSLAGVEWRITPLWWVSLGWMIAFGAVFAGLLSRGERRSSSELLGLGLLVPPAALTHNVGHWLGGRLVGRPLRGVLLNASMPFDLYDDEGAVSPGQHLARAVGGPVTSLAIGSAAMIAAHRTSSRSLRFFGALNVMIGVCALAPVPGIDGEVVLREVPHVTRADDIGDHMVVAPPPTHSAAGRALRPDGYGRSRRTHQTGRR